MNYLRYSSRSITKFGEEVAEEKSELRGMPFTMEELTKGLKEWRNIPLIIRLAFENLFKTVEGQGRQIEGLKKLEVEIGKKTDFEEIKEFLGDVASTVDSKVEKDELADILHGYVEMEEFKRSMEGKMGVEDFQRNSSNNERFAKEIEKLGTDFLVEINDLKSKLDAMESNKERTIPKNQFMREEELLKNMVDYESLEKILEAKVDKSEAYEIFDTKADIVDVQETLTIALDQKVGVDEFNNALEILQKQSRIDESLQNLKEENEMSLKIGQEELESIFEELKGKVDIEKIKVIESELLNLNNLTKKFCDDIDENFSSVNSQVGKLEKEMKRLGLGQEKYAKRSELKKIKEKLGKKIGQKEYNGDFGRFKEDVMEDILLLKNENSSFRVGFEQDQIKIARKLDKDKMEMIKSVRKMEKDFKGFKRNRDQEIDEITKYIDGKVEGAKSEMILAQENFAQKFESVISEFLDLKENICSKEFLKKKMAILTKKLKSKVELLEVEEGLNACQADVANRLMDLKEEITDSVKFQMNSMLEMLTKKASSKEMKKLLAKKINSDDVELILEDKVKSELIDNLGIEDFFEKVKEIEERISGLKPGTEERDVVIDSLRKDIKMVKRQMKLKADTQNIVHVLDQKIDAVEVRKVMKEIQTVLSSKLESHELTQFVNEQSLINEFLCTENILGRWKWKSGAICHKNSMIPWEIQTINTLADNFIWDKNSPYITIMTPGLYKISFAVFSKKKPKANFIVNGQAIICALNSSAYLKGTDGKNKFSQDSDGVTGISFIDFIMLGPRSQIGLSFESNMPGEGFMSLQRIQ